MSKNINPLLHVTINFSVLNKLEISLNEYALCEMTYHLQNNPESKTPGWCHASRPYYARLLGISERGIYKMIKRLTEKGLITKQAKTGHLKTTTLWYNNAVLTSKQNFDNKPLNKVHATPEQSSGSTPEQSSPNINTYIYKDNTKNFKNSSGAYKKTEKKYELPNWSEEKQNPVTLKEKEEMEQVSILDEMKKYLKKE